MHEPSRESRPLELFERAHHGGTLIRRAYNDELRGRRGSREVGSDVAKRRKRRIAL
jgi:hypothetical protein